MNTIIRKTRAGDYLTTGRVTIDEDGLPLTYLRGDEVKTFTFSWGDYFTRDDETVTLTLTASRCTAEKADGTDSAVITISAPSEGDCYVVLKVAVAGGDTFVMRLNIIGTAVE